MFSEDRIYLMKKPLKLYGWSWVAAIAATLISNEGFTTVYEIDEDEGIFIFLPIAIAFTILFKWGLILITISIIRRVKNRK